MEMINKDNLRKNCLPLKVNRFSDELFNAIIYLILKQPLTNYPNNYFCTFDILLESNISMEMINKIISAKSYGTLPTEPKMINVS